MSPMGQQALFAASCRQPPLATAAPAFSWSAEQEAIFDEVENGDGHIVVVARAGTGKTTTSLEAARRCVNAGLHVALFAFNVSVAEELRRKAASFGLPSTEWIRTLNSFGYGELSAARSTSFDDRRAWQVLRSMSEARLVGKGAGARRKTVLAVAKRVVGLSKAFLVPPEVEAITELLRYCGIDLSEVLDRHEIGLFLHDVIDALTLLSRLDGTCDYDDQIWLPVVHGLVRPRFDVVFIDEVQDLTRAQTELAMRACKPGGRIVAIGDDMQAIYGFRGADVQAIDRIVRRLDATVLPLATTRRCPTRVVEMAQGMVDDFCAAPDAPEGFTACLDGFDGLLDRIEAGDWVISRTNAALVKTCFRLLKRGRPATILKGEIDKKLIRLVEKTKVNDDASVNALQVALGRLEADELGEHADTDDDSRGANVSDKYDCIRVIAQEVKTVGEVKEALKRLFRDGERQIICTSTHRAKGLEADRVFVLNDTYTYFTRHFEPRPEDLNLAYVAVTRAKRELYLVLGLT